MKNIIVLIVTVLYAAGTFANQPLTLEDCRNLAVEYNKELKKKALQKQEAILYEKAARTAFLASLSADANFMHMMDLEGFGFPGGFLPTAENAEAAQGGNFSGQSNVWSPGMEMKMDKLTIAYGGLGISQPLYAGGKILNSRKKATQGIEVADLAYSLKYAEIIELTDQAFWDVAMVAANIDLAEEYMEMLIELEGQMEDMYEVGLTPASEKLKVSVQKNEAELQLMMANNALKMAKMNLNQVLGQRLDSEIEIIYDKEVDVELLDLAGGVENALVRRNELYIIDKQLEMTISDKKIAQADYLPQAGLGVQYLGSYVDDFAENISFKPMIAAQVSIPIFSWGRGKYIQNAANYKIKQIEAEKDNANDLISLEVLNTKIKVKEAYEAIIIARKNITEASESLNETTLSFEVGLNTTTELLNAQADWQRANSQLIQALATFKVLETTWARVIGDLQPLE